MMIKYFSFIVLVVWGVLQSCKPQNPMASAESYLGIRWMHAHEEDSGGHRRYRPASFEFPSSRGRTGFELNAGGTGVWGRIAPTDGIIWDAISWRLLPDNIMEITVLPKGKTKQTRTFYRIHQQEKVQLTLVFLREESGKER